MAADMKSTQSNRILQSMELGFRISPVEALRDFGCFRLAARISDLRREGHNINSRMVESTNQFGEPVRFKEYWIDDFHLEAV